MTTGQSDYYPAFLEVRGRRCVVVGGGQVGAAKATSLLSRGAHVTVVSPTLVPMLAEAVATGRVAHVPRCYVRGDLCDALVVIAATGDREANEAIAAEARAERALLNVVDAPELSDFIVPAVVRRGPMQLAVSTGGAAPSVARQVRERLDAEFGEEWAAYVALVGRVRALARERVGDEATRRRLAETLAASDLLDRLRAGEAPDPVALLGELLAQVETERTGIGRSQ